ncbi:MAG: tyrosine-type recombinase/integrase [Bifidobacteriaceae bacterium]|jgi:site-specific recombinase XerD|nr:tyrosine-type recombinase/integrase [Bifidobacteriaceae bacterium]
MTLLAPVVQSFFTDYLAGQRKLSPNTIRAYRDTWKLLLSFLSDRTGTPVGKLALEHVVPDNITGFLDHLETGRGNSPSTRNARLAAINAFCHHAAGSHPDCSGSLARIGHVPAKKHPKPDLTWLDDTETQALLDAIPTSRWTGRRDLAMLTLACHTGLRVGELASLTTADIQLASPAHIACRGKGRKRRITPINQAAVSVLTPYLRERAGKPGQALFPGPAGRRLSPDAIRLRLAGHIHAAAQTCPTLTGKHVTMHSLRNPNLGEIQTSGWFGEGRAGGRPARRPGSLDFVHGRVGDGRPQKAAREPP